VGVAAAMLDLTGVGAALGQLAELEFCNKSGLVVRADPAELKWRSI
jgi:hypothetical protein